MAQKEDDIKDFLSRLDEPPTEITVSRVVTNDFLTGEEVIYTIRTWPDGRTETIESPPRPWRGNGKPREQTKEARRMK